MISLIIIQDVKELTPTEVCFQMLVKVMNITLPPTLPPQKIPLSRVCNYCVLCQIFALYAFGSAKSSYLDWHSWYHFSISWSWKED